MVVYPRWRGELCYIAPNTGLPDGLSPLARGTRVCPLYVMRTSRFIPAGAGNSPCLHINSILCPVYPRWRGELCCHLKIKIGGDGLSPLARGTREFRLISSDRSRFIPAGAGNSHGAQAVLKTVPVYPRWRGELDSGKSPRDLRFGLSPLARGTQPE